MAQLLLPVMECGSSAWLAGSASDDREDDEDIDGEKLVIAMGNARNMMCNCQVRGTRIRASCLVRGKLVTRTLIKMRIDKCEWQFLQWNWGEPTSTPKMP